MDGQTKQGVKSHAHDFMTLLSMIQQMNWTTKRRWIKRLAGAVMWVGRGSNVSGWDHNAQKLLFCVIQIYAWRIFGPMWNSLLQSRLTSDLKQSLKYNN